MESFIIATAMGALFGAREWYRTMVFLYGRFRPTRDVLLGMLIKAMQWSLFGASIALIATVLGGSRLF